MPIFMYNAWFTQDKATPPAVLQQRCMALFAPFLCGSMEDFAAVCVFTRGRRSRFAEQSGSVPHRIVIKGAL